MMETSLDGLWSLKAERIAPESSVKCGDKFDITIPGEVHTALLDKHIIPDPYRGENEKLIQWVGRSDWSIERTFSWKKEAGRTYIKLTKVDTLATLFINDKEVGRMDNEHQAHIFDLTDFLQNGENTIRFYFASTFDEANRRAAALPYPVPYSSYPINSPHRNLIRKTQCQAGWDWGLCLQTVGIYESVKLINTEDIVTLNTSIMPFKKDGAWKVNAEVEMISLIIGEYPMSLDLRGKTYTKNVKITKGHQRAKATFEIDNDGIELWWPNGWGDAVLYDAKLSLLSSVTEKKIGFRTVRVSNDTKLGGRELCFIVNGERIFAKGSNWIPLDALPARITRERYYKIIKDAKDTNQNMLRLWGGGRFEFDDFYDACDENGILIWHDLMFACATYPINKEFFSSVEKELRYQIRRLKDRPSIALWCGSNENLGCLTWYPESRENRDFYLASFDRLYNGLIGPILEEEDPSRLYWPCSPCGGKDDYGNNHATNQKNGDMHIWQVWHEGKDFEYYHDMKPRFASEFGYQSFPSPSGARLFCPEEEMNLTSPVFEHHQKHPRGNATIIESFARYFRFPSTMSEMLYLSQAQQAWAIEHAVTYWRSLAPYSMGTLFWQLNDVWPVCSWSAVEYSGKWKLLMYDAQHFFEPVIPLLYLNEEKLHVYISNDTKNDMDAEILMETIGYDGRIRKSETFTSLLRKEESTEILSRELDQFDVKREFVRVTVKAGDITARREIFLTRPKYTEMRDPGLEWSIEQKGEKTFSISFRAKAPAFWVAVDHDDIDGRFSDNMFQIYPGEEKETIFNSKDVISLEEFRKKIALHDLWSSSRAK